MGNPKSRRPKSRRPKSRRPKSRRRRSKKSRSASKKGGIDIEYNNEENINISKNKSKNKWCYNDRGKKIEMKPMSYFKKSRPLFEKKEDELIILDNSFNNILTRYIFIQ